MKYIQLTQGQVAIVDDDDYEKLNKYKWYASKQFNTYYARRNESRKNNCGKQKTIRMHDEIMNISKGQLVDHKDGNGLNNRKNNLRIATAAQNGANKGKFSKASSKYKGVFWDKGANKWGSGVCFKGKKFHLGLHKNEIDAAKAYDVKAKELFGEFAKLNFPDNKKEAS